MNEPARDGLEENHHVNGQSNSMVWICKASIRPNSEPSKDEDDGGQGDSQDLEVDVGMYRAPRIPSMVTGHEDGSGNNEEESDGSNDSVAFD